LAPKKQCADKALDAFMHQNAVSLYLAIYFFFRPMNDHAASAIMVTATMIHISRKISLSEVMRVMPMPAMTNMAAIIKKARIDSTYRFSSSI